CPRVGSGFLAFYLLESWQLACFGFLPELNQPVRAPPSRHSPFFLSDRLPLAQETTTSARAWRMHSLQSSVTATRLPSGRQVRCCVTSMAIRIHWRPDALWMSKQCWTERSSARENA